MYRRKNTILPGIPEEHELVDRFHNYGRLSEEQTLAAVHIDMEKNSVTDFVYYLEGLNKAQISHHVEWSGIIVRFATTLISMDKNYFLVSIFSRVYVLRNLGDIGLSLNSALLIGIDYKAFKDIASMRHLELYDHFFRVFPSGICDSLVNLELLSITNSGIERINSFVGLSSLRKLVLNDNRIEVIKANMFEGLALLKELYLCENIITIIEENGFAGLSNLRELYMDSNPIESIEKGSLNGLYRLEVLELSLIMQPSFDIIKCLPTLKVFKWSISEAV